jgi:DNA modification methylase
MAPPALAQRYEAAVPLERLRPNPANPNTGDQDLLTRLLEANGFAGAVLAQEGTGLLIDGETRWRSAAAEGLATVPVLWVDVDDDAAARLLASINESTRRGRDDPAKLLALLTPLAASPRGLAGTAHTEDQLAALTKTLGGGSNGAGGNRLQGDPDETPEPPPDPVTQPGDVWQLGAHRLVCGDCFDPPVMKALTGGKRAHMALTDPPYAIYGSSTGVASEVADDSMVRPFFEAMWRVIAGHVVLFAHAYVHCDWRSWSAVWDAGKRAKMAPRNMIVWDKGGFGLGDNYANNHELIAFFARLPAKVMTNPATGQRPVYKPNVMHYPRPAGQDRLHNAAKPVALLTDLITNSSDDGQTVLDLYAGSGSVLVAAEGAGRVSWSAEKEPQWCDVTIQRWMRLTGGTPTREDGPPWPGLRRPAIHFDRGARYGKHRWPHTVHTSSTFGRRRAALAHSREQYFGPRLDVAGYRSPHPAQTRVSSCTRAIVAS